MNAVWTVFVIALAGEMSLYFAAPVVFASVARVPFGPTRRLVLHPRAADALREPPREGAGYRTSAVSAIDLGRLAVPADLDLDGSSSTSISRVASQSPVMGGRSHARRTASSASTSWRRKTRSSSRRGFSPWDGPR